MMNRISQAIRILLGKPLRGLALDSMTLLDDPGESEWDFTTKPPFDLAFDGVLANAPPVKILREENFRVCVFPERKGEPCVCCGKPLHWLVLELRGKDKWFHLVTMHESRLAIMLSALQDVAMYLSPDTAGRNAGSKPGK